MSDYWDGSVYAEVDREIRHDWQTHPYADPPTTERDERCGGCGQVLCESGCGE